ILAAVSNTSLTPSFCLAAKDESEQIKLPEHSIYACAPITFATLLPSDSVTERQVPFVFIDPQCLLLEDSDSYSILTEKEREEFLVRLFRHICIGGEICQQEDEIKPYIDTVRKIYRDLICVQKNPDSKAIEIVSHVYEVRVYVSELPGLILKNIPLSA
ncbi:uncharacterized protein DC041_0003925, partial [Schistosoma bovis]